MGDIKLKQASSGLKLCHQSLLPFSACWALPFDPVAFASNQRVGQGSIRDDMLGKRQGTHGTRKDLCPTLFLPGHYSLCGLRQMCSPPWASRHSSVRWGVKRTASLGCCEGANEIVCLVPKHCWGTCVLPHVGLGTWGAQ